MARPINQKHQQPFFKTHRPPPIDTAAGLKKYVQTLQELVGGDPTREPTVAEVMAAFADGSPATEEARIALIEELKTRRSDAHNTAQRQQMVGPDWGVVVPPPSTIDEAPGLDVRLPLDTVIEWMTGIAHCISNLPEAAEHFDFWTGPASQPEFEYGVRLALSVGLGAQSPNAYDRALNDEVTLPRAASAHAHGSLLDRIAQKVTERGDGLEIKLDPHSVADVTHEMATWIDVLQRELEQTSISSNWGTESLQQGRAFVHVGIMNHVYNTLTKIVDAATPSYHPFVQQLRSTLRGQTGLHLLSSIEEVDGALRDDPEESDGDLRDSLVRLLFYEQKLLAILKGQPTLPKN